MRIRSSSLCSVLLPTLALCGIMWGAQNANAQTQNCFDTLAGMPDMTRMVGVLSLSHVGEDLREVGPFTIFAPTDKAIESASPLLRDRVFPREAGGNGAADPVIAPAVVNAHILIGRYTSAALPDGQSVKTKTRAGNVLEVSNKGGKVTLTTAEGISATVVKADVACSNGVIHVIDQVLVR